MPRNPIAEAAQVVEYANGDRGIAWKDGVQRRYSREQIAAMFIEAVERGHMNPLLERLLKPHELRELSRALEDANAELAAVVAAIPRT